MVHTLGIVSPGDTHNYVNIVAGKTKGKAM